MSGNIEVCCRTTHKADALQTITEKTAPGSRSD